MAGGSLTSRSAASTPFKAKLANAERPETFPPPHVGGYGAVTVCLNHGGPKGAKPKAEAVADILASIKERRA